jgi:hypothetical protein
MSLSEIFSLQSANVMCTFKLPGRLEGGAVDNS